ncbi:MAG TPA: glycosyltransferase family 2 protein [Patescibacteria group bacterium]|nr:glycosyltransferase family 2 protein [Patescibacteria group bacterium]
MHKVPNSQITCIIPTFTNTKGLITLVSFLRKIDCYIVIIDNDSTQEKKDFFKPLENHVAYLPQKENKGFSASINKGTEYAQNEWLAILNDDIEINDQALFNKLINYAQKNNLCATTPVLVKPNGKVENYGYQVLPWGKIKLITHYDPLHTNSDYLDGLTAACLLIKTEIFKKIGGFDERFFAYLEDVDLFLRLKKKGKKFGVCGTISVVHNHMTTSIHMGNFKQKQDFKNWIRIIIKHWDRKTVVKNFPSIFIERLRNISGIIKQL